MEQLAFEKKLFQKTARQDAEIIMLEGSVVVYRSNVDLFFYVIGSADENELILAQVLAAFYDAVSAILRDNVEKILVIDQLGAVMLILDEMVDNGVILELDPYVLSKSALSTVRVPPP